MKAVEFMRTFSHFGRRLCLCAAVVVGSLAIAPTARAAFHLWNVQELYTNSSGTLQFIEFSTTFSGQNFVGGQTISITSAGVTHSFTMPSNLSTSIDTTNKDFIIGTAGVQAAGGPAPDFIIPSGFLFSAASSISFFGANSGPYTALPIDGTMARVFTTGATVVNNPENFSGQTGEVVPLNGWTGASSTSWAATGNWSGAVPGATTGTTNTNTAMFNQNAANSPTVIDAGRNLENITFDTASVNSLTIGSTSGQSLLMTAAGTIQATSTVVNTETVNAPLVLEGGYTFTSGATSATATLTFGGGITPGPTTGTTTLTLNGGNTGTNKITGALTDHSTGHLAISKSGAGLWVLSGANNYSGGTTVSAGTLEFDTAPTIDNNTTFQVNGGTLRFKVATGTANVGTGVTATVASGGTLELAGSVAALAAGANRVNITNSSTAPAGLLVSGSNQQVGKISGAGTTQVNAGSSLIANDIVQGALAIGGTSTSHGLVTIDASNASGNPLASLAAPADSTPEVALGAEPVGASAAGPVGDVPEPSSVILFAIGGLAIGGARCNGGADSMQRVDGLESARTP